MVSQLRNPNQAEAQCTTVTAWDSDSFLAVSMTSLPALTFPHPRLSLHWRWVVQVLIESWPCSWFTCLQLIYVDEPGGYPLDRWAQMRNCSALGGQQTLGPCSSTQHPSWRGAFLLQPVNKQMRRRTSRENTSCARRVRGDGVHGVPGGMGCTAGQGGWGDPGHNGRRPRSIDEQIRPQLAAVPEPHPCTPHTAPPPSRAAVRQPRPELPLV